jgi:serpin B
MRVHQLIGRWRTAWLFASKSPPTSNLLEKSASPSTRFAFKIFRQLAAEHETRNVFFSPASVMLCLWLLKEGATGLTRDSMATVLEVAGLDAEALQLAIVELKSALQIDAPGLQLEAANSLWCNHEWVPRSEYISKAREDYDAEVMTADFRDVQTASRMNSWVSAKTRGKIGNILSSLDPLAALVAINAIYFKDLWSGPFERRLTREETFHTSDGRKEKVPLMGQYGSYPYYEESKFQAVRLRYRTSRLAMYVFLPAQKSSVAQFHQNLNAAAWDKWTQRLQTTEGHIRLPRFKLTYEVILNSALEKLGMGIAFDRQRARFDGINPLPPEIWIGQILHRAFVEINEEGTEAAAVTATMVPLSALRVSKPPRTFEMIVDRPFFFAICDDQTNTILFMGSVEDPNS